MKKETDAKRADILKAAQECFSLYGFKRTVMEDIARRAGISRPALYLLFPNKESIFRALSEELHNTAFQRAELALSATGSLEQRFIAAFEGRDLEFIAIVEQSAHGIELMDLKDSIAADIAEMADTRFTGLLTTTLQQAERDGEIRLSTIQLDASECAELLSLAVAGIKQPPCRLAPYRQRLPQLIRVFFVALTHG